jgi:hypothetical protein
MYLLIHVFSVEGIILAKTKYVTIALAFLLGRPVQEKCLICKPIEVVHMERMPFHVGGATGECRGGSGLSPSSTGQIIGKRPTGR